MDILLIILSIVGLVHVVEKMKQLIRATTEEQKTINITSEGLLFFICIFELIRIIFYT